MVRDQLDFVHFQLLHQSLESFFRQEPEAVECESQGYATVGPRSLSGKLVEFGKDVVAKRVLLGGEGRP